MSTPLATAVSALRSLNSVVNVAKHKDLIAEEATAKKRSPESEAETMETDIDTVDTKGDEKVVITAN